MHKPSITNVLLQDYNHTIQYQIKKFHLMHMPSNDESYLLHALACKVLTLNKQTELRKKCCTLSEVILVNCLRGALDSSEHIRPLN